MNINLEEVLLCRLKVFNRMIMKGITPMVYGLD